jgi:hypothetical protein
VTGELEDGRHVELMMAVRFGSDYSPSG